MTQADVTLQRMIADLAYRASRGSRLDTAEVGMLHDALLEASANRLDWQAKCARHLERRMTGGPHVTAMLGKVWRRFSDESFYDYKGSGTSAWKHLVWLSGGANVYRAAVLTEDGGRPKGEDGWRETLHTEADEPGWYEEDDECCCFTLAQVEGMSLVLHHRAEW